MVQEVTDSNFKELLGSAKPIVLDFWAEWCGPCRMISPIIESLANEYADRVTIGKVNIEENANDIVSQYNIRSVPTVMFFRDGKMVDKLIGASQRSLYVEKIEALLN